jgi:hypothetical protein
MIVTFLPALGEILIQSGASLGYQTYRLQSQRLVDVSSKNRTSLFERM